MYRKPLRAQRLLYAAAMLALGAGTAHAAEYVWTGAVSTNWSDPANWSAGNPATWTLSDTLYIPSSGVANQPANINTAGLKVGNVYYTGSSLLTVSGQSLDVNRIATRHNRNITYTSGSTTVTVTSTVGTAGLQVGMPVSGTGIPAGATIASIVDGTTFTLSSAATASGSSQSRSFDATANIVWNGNLVLNSTTTNFNDSGRTMTFNGNISGAGALSANGSGVDGTIELKGINTYSGFSYANTGTIRFYGQQALSPNTTLGNGFGNLRFSSTTGTGEFLTRVGNGFVTGGGAPVIQVDAGGRIVMTGDIVEASGAGIRGVLFNRPGSGVALVDVNGAYNTDGQLSVGAETFVRLNTTSITAYGGNTDITSSTDRSGLDGTLDLNGRNFDRKFGSNNNGGALGAGNLVNSKLDTPSTVSGSANNLGTNVGSKDFGGPGTLILTGGLRVAAGATDTGLQKVGPGAVILRTTSFAETTAGSNNPNDVICGTLVLDHAANNAQKISDDQMEIQNGRLVILGNNSASTIVTTGNFNLGANGLPNAGYAEVDVRSGTGAGTTTTLALGNITASGTGATFNSAEVLNFQVTNNGGGTARITTTSADAVLPATVTFNKSQWAQVSSGQVVGLNPELVAGDAATFQTSSGYTQNIDVTGSFTTSAATNLRTMRFTQAGGTTLTLNAIARLNRDNAGGGVGSGILVTSTSGAVTIDGSQGIDIGANTSLTIYQHSASPLTIDARIQGASGSYLNKVGTGELILNNINNSFGAAPTIDRVQVSEGTLTVPYMSNAGTNSPIGAANTIIIGNKNTVDYATGVATQAPARFRYTGAGHQTDRGFQLIGVAEIQANGTGLLDFTRTGATAVVASPGSMGAWNDLILSGSGAGRFNGLVDLGFGNLVKRESGTWTLSSTAQLKTYGKLQIDAGTFVQDGSLASIHTQTIVGNGATLMGSGSVAALQVLSGGTLAPGHSAGTFTAGDLQLDGTLAAEVNGLAAGSEYDRLSILGSATLGAASNLQFTLGYVPSLNDSFTLLSNDGVDAIVGQFATVNNTPVAGNTFTVGSYQFQLNYAGGDGNDLVATATVVPEPAVLMSMLGTTFSVLMLRRRSR